MIAYYDLVIFERCHGCAIGERCSSARLRCSSSLRHAKVGRGRSACCGLVSSCRGLAVTSQSFTHCRNVPSKHITMGATIALNLPGNTGAIGKYSA